MGVINIFIAYNQGVSYGVSFFRLYLQLHIEYIGLFFFLVTYYTRVPSKYSDYFLLPS